ncbi:hypothetical protein OH77DRAFT_1409659, partial [Trametes cingulata]
MIVEAAQLRGVRRHVSRDTLDSMFQFKAVQRDSSGAMNVEAGDILASHSVDPASRTVQYIFKSLSGPRKDHRLQSTRSSRTHSDRPARAAALLQDPKATAYMEVASVELRRAIIAEWQKTLSTAALKELVCAVCARDTDVKLIQITKAREIDLSLLCNPLLPPELQPRSYNRAAYDGAILHPEGLTDRSESGDIQVCKECFDDLAYPRVPKYALANWLYYGHEHLPADVSKAFSTMTTVERILVSRARASKISYKFSELEKEVSGKQKTPAAISQRCVKGNVAIHPQDATHLHDVLPPSHDVIRDTVCAVFVGQMQPSQATIEKLTPILVRKSRVKTIIKFLITHNPHYRPGSTDFQGYSQQNLDNLLGPGTSEVDEGMLCSMEIGHIAHNDAVDGATSSYVPGHDDGPCSGDDDMLMENVGYTDGDDTPVNYRKMTMIALAHCANGGRFIKSQAGSRFIPDFENSQLLSWLFPHLDPWGIGGFFMKERLTKLSMESQLRYLLRVHNSPFRDDPDFAFVYYNILQKKAVFDSVTFRVAASERDLVIKRLLEVNVRKLEKMTAAFKQNPHYRPADEEEVAILKLLLKVNTVAHDLPGSNGYKVTLRNQIRGLINHEGTPNLFITLNPSDRDHPLVRLYAGDEVNLEDASRGEELTRWSRTIRAARNPAACARFFDTMITNFISVVLRFGREGKGLFG